MSIRVRSLHTAALGAAIAILAIAAPAARVGAASSSACTTTSGVTVIVDFTHFGRSLERGCAPGTPATALAAMHAAGFGTAGTTRYGDAFLCRIADLPAPKDEACGDTPPANSSWSFYYARSGDKGWTYSPTGVLLYRPPAGSIIAFAFGRYAPGVRPAVAIPVPPTTIAIVDPPPPTAPPVTRQPVSRQVGEPTTVTPATAAPPPAVAPTTAPRPAPTRAPTTSTGPATPNPSPRIVDRTATGSISDSDPGSPRPALLGAALVVALAVIGGVTIRARRRRSA